MAFIDTITWIGSFGLVIIWLLTANWIYCYYKLKHIDAIKSRRPNVILLTGYLYFIDLMVKPTLLLSANGQIPMFFGFVGNVWMFIIFILTVVLSMYLLVYRGYITYFKIKWNLALADVKWRLYIDPTEQNWFLANKNKWGNGRRILIILMCFYIPFSAIAIIRALTGFDNIARYILVLNMLIIITFGLILYCKFPSFDDIWHVGKEIKISMISLVCLVLTYLVVNAILSVEFPDPIGVITVYISAICSLALNIGTMKWVFIKHGLPSNIYSLYIYLHTSNKTAIISHSNIDRSNIENKSFKFKDVLEDEHFFNLFARHLSKEFSIENLLYFLESAEWIHYLRHMDSNIENTENDILLNIRFPETAPKSRLIQEVNQNVGGVVIGMDGSVYSNQKDKIIHKQENKTVELNEFSDGSDQILNCYFSGIKLFQKYIVDDAYFAINISFEEREKLYKIFGYSKNNNELSINEMVKHLKTNCNVLSELSQIFDNSRYEVYKLMNYSYFRFKQSDEYQKHFSE
eukprot:37008_1